MQSEKLALARSVLAGAEAKTARFGLVSRQRSYEVDANASMLALPKPFEHLIQGGRVARGSSISCTDSLSLLYVLAAAAMGSDGWCGVVGLPTVSARALADAGCDLDRVIVLYPALTDLPAFLSAAAEGFSVLLMGDDLQLSPALWRTLREHARRDGCLLLSAATRVTDLIFKVNTIRWLGLNAAGGRLQRRLVEISAAGKRALPVAGELMWLPDLQGSISLATAAKSNLVPLHRNTDLKRAG